VAVYYDQSFVQSGAFPAVLAIVDSRLWYPMAGNLPVCGPWLAHLKQTGFALH
jgi:hypothetical protein